MNVFARHVLCMVWLVMIIFDCFLAILCCVGLLACHACVVFACLILVLVFCWLVIVLARRSFGLASCVGSPCPMPFFVVYQHFFAFFLGRHEAISLLFSLSMPSHFKFLRFKSAYFEFFKKVVN